MRERNKLTIFLIIAFILPLILVIIQSRSTYAGISFVLFGIQAASLTISAVIVLGLSKELYSTVANELNQKNLMLHIVAISPFENNGVTWPYVILTIMEGLIASYIIARARIDKS